MNAPEMLPLAPHADEPMTAEQYQREAIATAQSEAMDPEYQQQVEDLG